MIRFFSVVKKNFKLLIRSRSSAFVVFIGPLLIIALVGLVFSGKSTYELSIGYFAPEKTDLTNSFISALHNSSYVVHEFSSEQDCVDKIEQGVIHTCIIFPKGFSVNNDNPTDLRFLVDYSRINLVYKVIQSVSGILDFKTKEVSYSLTSILLSNINGTIDDINSELGMQEKISGLDQQSLNSILASINNSDAMKLDAGTLDFGRIKADIASLNSTANSVADKAQLVVDNSNILISDLSGAINSSELSDLQAKTDNLSQDLLAWNNQSIIGIGTVWDDTLSLESSLNTLQQDLAASKNLNEDTKKRLGDAQASIQEAYNALGQLKSILTSSKNSLQGITVSNAETIVSPVNTKIEPVTSQTSNIDFTFPFLLILVIMFVALLLSSTLIIFENNSKAFFRNFMLPVSKRLFILSSFFTVILIIVVQSLVILLVAQQFLKVELLVNPWTTLAIIIVAAFFFAVLGMIIGYSFSSQEGAVMASLVIGSVFLFVSNMVVPLESISTTFSWLIAYNPFIIFSELLRKALLFKLGFFQEANTLGLLFGFALLILIIILAVKGRQRKAKGVKAFDRKIAEEEKMVHAWAFQIGKRKATNREELLNAVSECTKAEFEDCVNGRQNKIADWVEEALQDKKLAAHLRKTTAKAETIKILGEDVHKHDDADEDKAVEDKE